LLANSAYTVSLPSVHASTTIGGKKSHVAFTLNEMELTAPHQLSEINAERLAFAVPASQLQPVGGH
jgi:hypothetical protein